MEDCGHVGETAPLRLRRSVVWALALMAALAMAHGKAEEVYASTSVSYPAVVGQIVAEETGQPPVGVGILAFWSGSKKVAMFFADTVKVLEVESRENGTFVLRAWGPIAGPEPPRPNSPIMVCFPPAFEPTRIDLGPLSPGQASQPIGTPEQSAGALTSIVWTLTYAVALPEGPPTPKLLTAVKTEWRRLPKDVSKDSSGTRKMLSWLAQEFRRAFERKSWEQG